jgi:hypothetical protein
MGHEAVALRPAVKRWIKAHPRFHLHFTLTSASWLNIFERFFAEITRNRIHHGAFRSVAELKSAIYGISGEPQCDPSVSSGPSLRAKSSKRRAYETSVRVTTLVTWSAAARRSTIC